MTATDAQALDLLLESDPAAIRALYFEYGADPAGISPHSLARMARDHGEAFTEKLYRIFSDGKRPKKEIGQLIGFGGEGEKDRKRWKTWFGRVTNRLNGSSTVAGALDDHFVHPEAENEGCNCGNSNSPLAPEPTVLGLNPLLFGLALVLVVAILTFAYLKAR